MLKGKAQPHRVTRLVILLAAITGVIGVIGSDNLSGIIFAGIFLARAGYLFIMSMFFGIGGSSTLDKTCLFVGILAIGAYAVTGSGLLAVCLGLLADIIAYIPTFVKTWKKPDSEDPTFFAIEGVAALTAIIAISEPKVDILFPIYFFVCCVVVLLLIYRPKLMKAKPMSEGGLE